MDSQHDLIRGRAAAWTTRLDQTLGRLTFGTTLMLLTLLALRILTQINGCPVLLLGLDCILCLAWVAAALAIAGRAYHHHKED